jgi:hypothetical protein
MALLDPLGRVCTTFGCDLSRLLAIGLYQDKPLLLLVHFESIVQKN